jgi:DNA-binding transcriptional ArsR family regulator
MTVSATPGLIVARDLELVAWLDRLVGASVEQIRARFGLGRTQAYRRLQVLQDHGLVRRRHLSALLPPLYTVGSRSLRIASTQHAHALTELVVAIESAGGDIATELELRRERARQQELDRRLTAEQLATVLGCPRIPDAVELLASGGLCAYEVELSSKGRARRSRALADYAVSDYERVHWIAPDPQLAALLSAEIEERGLSDYVEVSDGLARIPS